MYLSLRWEVINFACWFEFNELINTILWFFLQILVTFSRKEKSLTDAGSQKMLKNHEKDEMQRDEKRFLTFDSADVFELCCNYIMCNKLWNANDVSNKLFPRWKKRFLLLDALMLSRFKFPLYNAYIWVPWNVRGHIQEHYVKWCQGIWKNNTSLVIMLSNENAES